MRNAQKENYEDDNILAPAPAINPTSSLEFQEVKVSTVDYSYIKYSINLYPSSEPLEEGKEKDATH